MDTTNHKRLLEEYARNHKKGKHMKRVMCLYRVSTRVQVDPQDDSPMQRRECQDFINRQSDCKFAWELMENMHEGDLLFLIIRHSDILLADGWFPPLGSVKE